MHVWYSRHRKKNNGSFEDLNRTPSRGQRKNIKFPRSAAERCWPFFMHHGGPKDSFDTIKGEAVDKEVDSPQR